MIQGIGEDEYRILLVDALQGAGTRGAQHADHGGHDDRDRPDRQAAARDRAAGRIREECCTGPHKTPAARWCVRRYFGGFWQNIYAHIGDPSKEMA